MLNKTEAGLMSQNSFKIFQARCDEFLIKDSGNRKAEMSKMWKVEFLVQDDWLDVRGEGEGKVKDVSQISSWCEETEAPMFPEGMILLGLTF